MAKFALTVVAIGALIVPIPAYSQLAGGVFGARAVDSFGGTNGFGAEVGVSLPMLPLEVFGAGTWFSPACDGCDLQGWSLGVKFKVFALPVLKPYLTFGRSWRDLEDPNNSLELDESGFFAGAGLEIALPGFGIFVEGDYEFMDDDAAAPEDLKQWILRVGLVLRWGGIPL